MSLIKWKPFNNEIDTFDNIIDQFFTDLSIDPRFSSVNVNTTSHYNENDKEYYLTMDVPGMSKDDIDIAFDNNRLKVSGQRQSDKYNSYEYGKMERSFNIPSNVQSDKISAKIDNGVLNVLLPKTKSSIGRKITVK
ncbi:MAG: Hsp20/alpha crystallin family protein [Candidatus Marinimicrobia bacterium]|jgi:HSP20 family protein|nr:Hsp20/alpha crystallin family protein [Candidatus Neomarinimicrobiota bacterium]|tara:strand:- start:84 stop:491 length:408 start_codon:yes stop_codon:yes gene_type:complete